MIKNIAEILDEMRGGQPLSEGEDLKLVSRHKVKDMDAHFEVHDRGKAPDQDQYIMKLKGKKDGKDFEERFGTHPSKTGAVQWGRNRYKLEESVDQLDEISKELINNYVKKAKIDLKNTEKEERPLNIKRDKYTSAHYSMRAANNEASRAMSSRDWNRASVKYTKAKKTADSIYTPNDAERHNILKDKINKRKSGLSLAKFHLNSVKEDVDQLDELSRGKLSLYVNKAKGDFDSRSVSLDNNERKLKNRDSGIKLALKKKWGDKKYGLNEPKVKGTTESVDQLDEISKATLGSYIKRSKNSQMNTYGDSIFNTSTDKHHQEFVKAKYKGNREERQKSIDRKISNRQNGINTATDKLITK